jgi:hypothetical protein
MLEWTMTNLKRCHDQMVIRMTQSNFSFLQGMKARADTDLSAKMTSATNCHLTQQEQCGFSWMSTEMY